MLLKVVQWQKEEPYAFPYAEDLLGYFSRLTYLPEAFAVKHSLLMEPPDKTPNTCGTCGKTLSEKQVCL